MKKPFKFLILSAVMCLTGCIVEPANSFNTLGGIAGTASSNIDNVPPRLHNTGKYNKHRMAQRRNNHRHHKLHH